MDVSYPPTNFLGTQRILWQLPGANMNSTADQAFTKLFTFTNHIITGFLVLNASTSLTLAVGGIYTATAKGGTAIVGAVQVYSALTAAGVTLNPTMANTNLRTDAAMYLSLTTPQGGAATADFYAIGLALT